MRTGSPLAQAGVTAPLIFIPGYAASVPVSGTEVQYVLNRGASPTDLQLSASYAPFVRSMHDAGYQDGTTFFGAVYDWRMAAAPYDGVNDGVLSLVTAQEMTSGNFKYAINYLGYWLDQAVQANPGLAYVDVVTHSAGGALARAYIQSPAYGGEYVDKNGVLRHLPKIRFLILGAFPNFGTVHSWRPWNADFQDVLAGFIPTTEIEGRLAAFAFAYVISGKTISGPDYTITRADILGKDVNGIDAPDPYTFFRLYDPMRQSLMPTTDFLTPQGGGTPGNVNNDDSVRSDILLDLNATSSPGNNPWVKLVGETTGLGGVTAAFSSGARTKTDDLQFFIPGLINSQPFIQTLTAVSQDTASGVFLPLLFLLQSNPAVIPDTQAKFTRVPDIESKGQLPDSLSGDGNAPYISYMGYFSGDPNVTIEEFGNGAVPTGLPDGVTWNNRTGYPCYHDVFYYNPQVRQFVALKLTNQKLRQEQPITLDEYVKLALFLDGFLI